MDGRKFYIEGDKSITYLTIKEAFLVGCEYYATFTIRQLSNDFPVWNYVTNKNTYLNGWLVKSINTQHSIKDAFLENRTYYAYKPVSGL